MLQALLNITINSSPFESSVQTWCEQKKRRKLPKQTGKVPPAPKDAAAAVAHVKVADAALQDDTNEFTDQMIGEMNAFETNSLLKLINIALESQDDLDSDYEY